MERGLIPRGGKECLRQRRRRPDSGPGPQRVCGNPAEGRTRRGARVGGAEARTARPSAAEGCPAGAGGPVPRGGERSRPQRERRPNSGPGPVGLR